MNCPVCDKVVFHGRYHDECRESYLQLRAEVLQLKATTHYCVGERHLICMQEVDKAETQIKTLRDALQDAEVALIEYEVPGGTIDTVQQALKETG